MPTSLMEGLSGRSSCDWIQFFSVLFFGIELNVVFGLTVDLTQCFVIVDPAKQNR